MKIRKWKVGKWEWLSWIAATLELSGVYFLGNKMEIGFILNIAGGIVWIVYSLLSKSAFGLLGVCSVGAILNMRGLCVGHRGVRR